MSVLPRLSNSAIILSNHSFPVLQQSPHRHVSALLNSQEGPSTDLQSSFPCNSCSPNLCYANSLPSVLPNFQLSLSLFFFFATPHCIWDLSFPTSNGLGPPALQAQSLNCCPTRKVPQHCLRGLGSQLSSSWASPSCATAWKLFQGSEQG